MHWSHWLGEAATAIIMGVFAFLFPYRPKEQVAAWHKKELHTKYKHWDWLALPLLFVFVPLITWLFGQIFIFQSQCKIKKSSEITYQILPEPNCWYVPACILAFGLACYPMLWVYKLILKDRYADYERYNNLKYQMDGNKAIHTWACVMGVVTLVCMHLLNNYYINIRSSDIEIHTLLQIKPKHYHFSGIKKLTYFKNIPAHDTTALVYSPHYKIAFNDGFTLNTQMGLHDAEIEPDAIDFLSNHSGKKIDSVEVDL